MFHVPSPVASLGRNFLGVPIAPYVSGPYVGESVATWNAQRDSDAGILVGPVVPVYGSQGLFVYAAVRVDAAREA